MDMKKYLIKYENKYRGKNKILYMSIKDYQFSPIWTENIAEAKEFYNVAEILTFAMKYELKNTSYLFHFPDHPKYNFEVPLNIK